MQLSIVKVALKARFAGDPGLSVFSRVVTLHFTHEQILRWQGFVYPFKNRSQNLTEADLLLMH